MKGFLYSNMLKVSIIIPTYNRGDLLLKAIGSVLAQTFRNYELIIVDDGSTDDTHALVETYLSDSIRYVYQDNAGKSAARNHGIRLAEGEYVAFLDSDDLFLPTKLEQQVRTLDSNGAYGFVYSNARSVDESGKYLDPHFEGDLSGWIYPAMLFIKNNRIATPTVMVRAKVLKEIGGFDETMHICEDLDLWRRVARKYQVLQIKEPLSIVRTRSMEQIDILLFMKARTAYYRKAFHDDPGLKDIKADLYVEMFGHYFNWALYYGNKPVAAYVLLNALLKAPGFAFPLIGNKISQVLRF